MKERAIITVVGADRKGIIAAIAGVLASNDVNIEDLSQKVMDDIFVMSLLADISEAKLELDQIGAALNEVGGRMGLRITVQHENIVRAMHRI